MKHTLDYRDDKRKKFDLFSPEMAPLKCRKRSVRMETHKATGRGEGSHISSTHEVDLLSQEIVPLKWRKRSVRIETHT